MEFYIAIKMFMQTHNNEYEQNLTTLNDIKNTRFSFQNGHNNANLEPCTEGFLAGDGILNMQHYFPYNRTSW